ncbi:MAG: PQQ-binding-like beta-propeller repeat protein, partial [Rhodospirillaceae bacterium]|nr:PQQ-binding-like beta-propeller repeat protein [Rhodospirillaceae bacterium]
MLLRFIVVLMVLVSGAVVAQDRHGDWPNFGNDPGGSQYSGLSQIDKTNVSKLKVAWMHRSGDFSYKDSKTGGSNLEVTPIHVNGTLYYCTPFNRVFALDPATGKEKWVFDPTVVKGPDGKPLLDKPKRATTCRGVSYWEAATPVPDAPCQRRIFKGDAFGNIYAIDADTGASCADFGAAKGHPGYASQLDYDNHGDGFAGGMGSPVGVAGDVIIATSSANDGLSNAADGVVRG